MQRDYTKFGGVITRAPNPSLKAAHLAIAFCRNAGIGRADEELKIFQRYGAEFDYHRALIRLKLHFHIEEKRRHR